MKKKIFSMNIINICSIKCNALKWFIINNQCTHLLAIKTYVLDIEVPKISLKCYMYYINVYLFLLKIFMSV